MTVIMGEGPQQLLVNAFYMHDAALNACRGRKKCANAHERKTVQ